MNSPLSRLAFLEKPPENFDAGGVIASRPVEGPVNAVLLDARVGCMVGISTLKAGTSPGKSCALLPVTLPDDFEAMIVDPEEAALAGLKVTLLALGTMGGTSAFAEWVPKRSLLRCAAAVLPTLLLERGRSKCLDGRVVSGDEGNL